MTPNGTSHTVQITMNEATVTALTRSQYFLYAFQGVQCSDAATMPLVWLQTQDYSENVMVGSSNDYRAYTSKSPIAAGQRVDIGYAAALAIGDLLTVNDASGIGAVTTEGAGGAISILNATNDPFTCGICVNGDPGGFGPACAMPLYGNGLQLIVPVAKILLLFSTMPMAPGTAITTTPNQGLLIDQNAAPAGVPVTFDINAGWSAGGEPYAQVIPARSSLAPLVAEYSAELAQMAIDLLHRVINR